jgi:hypothetical protein
MRGAFALGQISAEEKSDILNKHRHVYDGYRTMQPEVSNTQPLYVQDFANDKGGITVNNKGVVKPYTNMGINEQWQAAVGDALASYATNKIIDKVVDKFQGETSEEMEKKQTCSECGGNMMEGECSECGWKGEMDEETGHLDDIYHEEDLNPNAKFDYVNGGGNNYGTFKGSHKGLYEDKELDELGTHELEKGKKYKYNLPSFNDEIEFDDEFEDKTGGEKMYKFKGKNDMTHLMPGKNIEDFVGDLEEQGGNANDMNVDDVKNAYLQKMKGPEQFGDDTYSDIAPDMDLDTSKEWKGFEFDSEGPGMGNSFPVNEYDDEENFGELTKMDSEIEGERDNLEQEGYEQMESAWADDELDEIDVSGVQGMYDSMDPAYDFDSEGPGKAGPYQTREEEIEEENWSDVDEDLQESFINQKNKIMEMMNRMKVIK